MKDLPPGLNGEFSPNSKSQPPSNSVRHSVRDILFFILLMAVALEPALYLRLVNLDLSTGDEGVLLAAARRILHSQVPYRDFFAMLTPGAYYLTAAAFRILGENFLTARILAWCIHLILLLCTMRMAVRLGLGRGGLTLIVLGSAAFGFPYWPILSHHWMADALGMASLYLLWEAGVRDRQLYGLAAGAAAGATVLVLQDQGAYWILAALAAIASSAPSSRRRLSLSFLLGIGFAVIPVVSSLLVLVPFRELWSQLVLFPLEIYKLNPANRPVYASGLTDVWSTAVLRQDSRFYGALSSLAALIGGGIFTILATIIPATAVLLAFSLRSAWKAERERWSGTILAAGVLSISGMALKRPNLVDLAFAVPFALLACLWATKVLSRERAIPRLRKGVSILAGIAMAAAAVPLALLPLLPRGQSFAYPGGSVRSISPQYWPDLSMLEAFPARLYRKDQTVFCYSYSALWYFLLDVDNPTPYDNFGMERYSPLFVSNLLKSLDTSKPRWIVLDGRYSDQARDPVLAWMKREGYSVQARTSDMVIAGRATTKGN